MREITKQLQNLYSWTEFYQKRKMRNQVKRCQIQITQLKKEYNDLKQQKKKR